MQPIGVLDLLDLWDRGARQPPFRRALSLVAAACRDLSEEQIGALSLGDRDRLLLDARALTLGSRVAAHVGCPQCGALLDATFEAGDLSTRITPGEAPLAVEQAGYLIRFRLPTTADIAAVADTAAREDALLRRCILDARHEGAEIPVAALPEPLIDAVTEQMAQGDSSQVAIDVTCEACGHGWRAPFDVPAFFWEEIDAWAERTLVDVHTLASAYGWREADILAMAPRRRQRYLALIAEHAL